MDRYTTIKQGNAYLVWDNVLNRPISGLHGTPKWNAEALCKRFNADEAIKAARTAQQFKQAGGIK